MAFDNVVFPTLPLIHDQNREVIDPVAIATNGSYEYRVRRQRWEKFVWRLSTQTMTNAQKEEVRGFLQARNAGLNSFKYTDPELSTLSSALMSHNTGEYWNLAVPLDSSTAGTHPIFNPDTSSLTVTVDGSPGTIAGFSVLNGVPVIQVTGTTGSEVVRVSGTVYFTVRLGSNFQESLFALCTDNSPRGHVVQSITLVEVYGEY